jgi:hypothetical protein
VVCPLERRPGLIAGAWTPRAAKLATWVVAPLPSKEGEDLFALLEHMTPSKSTRDWLPKALSVPWEAQRPRFAATLRHEAAIPPEAVALAVALDDVMAPRKAGQRHTKRPHARTLGTSPRGPAGYQAAGWTTVSYYDHHGERLCTRRLARMPEAKKPRSRGR